MLTDCFWSQGPFEAGFTATQNNILEALGCADGNDGHLPGGIDTKYISAVASGV